MSINLVYAFIDSVQPKLHTNVGSQICGFILCTTTNHRTVPTQLPSSWLVQAFELILQVWSKPHQTFCLLLHELAAIQMCNGSFTVVLVGIANIRVDTFSRKRFLFYQRFVEISHKGIDYAIKYSQISISLLRKTVANFGAMYH